MLEIRKVYTHLRLELLESDLVYAEPQTSEHYSGRDFFLTTPNRWPRSHTHILDRIYSDEARNIEVNLGTAASKTWQHASAHSRCITAVELSKRK